MQSAGKDGSEMIDQIQVEKRNPWDLRTVDISIAAVTSDQT